MALQDSKATKVIMNGETLVDITETTATEEAVFSGRTFLGADGKAVTGTLKLPLQIVHDSGYLSLNKDKNTIYARYQSGTDVDSINPALFNRTPKTNEVFYALIKTNDNVYLPCYCQCTGVISGNNYWTFKIIYLVASDLTVQLSNQNLDDYKEVGRFYYGAGGNICANKPEDVRTFGMFVIRTAHGYYCQVLMAGDFPAQQIYTRTFHEDSSTWTSWQCQTSALILQRIVPFDVSYGSINISNYTNSIISAYFNRYPITGDTFVLTGISSDGKVFMCKAEVTDAKNSSNYTPFKIDQSSLVLLYDPSGFNNRIQALENNTAGYATRTEAQGYATAAKTEAKAYADSLAVNYDAKGSADQALIDAKKYTDETKAILLGENDRLIATYDTLAEIGQWIETTGVDATELTTAIATETQARQNADTGLTQQIQAEVSARTNADTTLKSELTESLNSAKQELSQDMASMKTAIENDTDTQLQELNNAIQTEITNAIAQQTSWTNAQLQSLYNDTVAEATSKANTAETNANAYTDQKIEDLSIEDINIVVDSELTPYSDNAVSSKGIMQRYYNAQASDFVFDSFNSLWHSVYNNTHTYEPGNTIIFTNTQGRFKCLVINNTDAGDSIYYPTEDDMFWGTYDDQDFSFGTTFCFTTSSYQPEEINVYVQVIQKLDYYTQAEIDAIFEPASSGPVIRDGNGDIIVPETPSSANAAISYAYAQEIGIANAIATRPYIREYTVDNNEDMQAKLTTLLSGYGDATGDGPYRGDHVKIIVTETGLTHLYYYNQTNNRADLPGWVEIAQYYTDLSSRLESLQNIDSDLYTKFVQLTCPLITKNLDFSSVLNLANRYMSFGGSGLGGVEIIPYGTNTKYDFILQSGTASPTFYKGPVQIIKVGTSGYTIIGDQCTEEGVIVNVQYLHMRTYYKSTAATSLTGGVTNASIYRPIICIK